ncbi:translation initiation factor IF-2 [Candidatus Nanohalococcus occultus]|uniref:translation initiation factor IF-2 n=1 Tax=Candidatus Nanohalococcus occultus TaxID=2978047 RepID=UPI0039E0EFCC
MPRQPIISVLGHIDAGKTTLLDNIRESRIVEGESGGITQMIGATEVPLETLETTCGDLLNQLDTELTIPGVLFIDTPGHAAFSSLRKRGGSISDIAIVVVDVDDGVQPQTEEAIRILKQNQTPFVIALNKIDKVHGWRSEDKSFMKSIRKQSDKVQQKVDEEIYELMGEINEFDLVVDRFDRVDNFRKKIGVVPISAKTGEGIPELLMVVSGLAQRYLGDRLEVHEGMGKGTVLEVSKEEGLGTTIDVIHYDGIIEKDQKLVYGTSDGVQVTDIRAILKPKPLKEIRVDKKYDRIDTSKPAGGVKLVGKSLEGVVSGAPVRTAHEQDLEEAKKEVAEELEAVEFETQEHGIVIKADSLGSLEAIMQEMEENEIPVQRAEVGDITKADAIDVGKEEPENRSIFAFNVDYTEQGKQAVIDKGIKVFQGQVIYEIIDGYTEWKKELAEKQRETALEATTRPAKIRVLEDHVFRKSKPAVVGVKVEEGVLNPGASLMNADGDRIGRVKAVQEQNESIDAAEKGSQVAASISGATVGRDFEEGEVLYTSLTGDDYKRLNRLEDLLSRHEKNVLEKIVEIQDSVDPRWKLG